MAGERVKLEVRPREARGSRESRRLRRQGLIPGVIYGGGKQPEAICVDERELRRAVTGPAGLHAILDVTLDGGRARPAVVKEYQLDPLRGHLIHVDLQEVRLDQAIQSQVAVHLVGEAAGAKEGGVLTQVLTELNVEAKPMDIPPHVEIDISELHIGDNLQVGELPPVPNVTFLDDPETVIATVAQPSRVEEPEEVTEEEEEVTGVPAGEQAPEGGAEAPLEPGADAAGSPGTTPG